MQNLLDLGTHIIGVDPGSRSLGVALVDGAGRPLRSWSVRPSGRTPMLDRQRYVAGALRTIFGNLAHEYPGAAVIVEDGIPRYRDVPAVPSVIGTLGEMRGIIMAEAWRAGLRVRKMSPLTWKCRLSKAERAMKKGADYVAYWRGVLGHDFRSPDAVDAALMARRASE